MEHEEIVERISEYLDDELSTADKELVERHLATCTECRETLNTMEAVTGMIAGTPRVELPAAAADRLAAAIDERVKTGAAPTTINPQRSWRRWATHPAFISVAGAAAVLVIAVAVWKSPAQISERSTQGSPTLSAPEAGGGPEYGGNQPQTAESEAAARQTVNERLNEAAAGTLLKTSSPRGAAEDRVSESTKLLTDRYADSGNISVDKAAELAGGGEPIRLLYSTSDAWKEDAAWIVIVERTDKPGYFIGAVVSQKDGRILYRKTKHAP